MTCPFKSPIILAAILASACSSPSKEPRTYRLALRSGERDVQVLADEERFARIVLSTNEPATVEALYGPGDRHILRGFPLNPRDGESVDHPEHLSMWTAHASVSGHNLWDDASGPRLMGHALRMRPGGRAIVEMDLDWRTPDGSVLCNEARAYSFVGNEAIRSIEVKHTLTATGGGLTFDDVREGFFALRLQDGFRVDRGRAKTQTSLNIEGQDPYGIRAKWIAYSAPIPDESGVEEVLTVCFFDHPENTGYPTHWFARPYGLVAANPFAKNAFRGPESFDEVADPQPFRISPHAAITLTYRVTIARGELTQEEIEALWRSFAGVPE